MRRIRLVVALAAPSLVAADLSGTWTGTWERQGDGRGVCVYFAQNGKQLQGRIAYQNDTKVSSITGVVAGDDVKFAIRDDDNTIVILRRGSVDASLVGTATTDGQARSITLKQYRVPSSYYQYGQGREEPVVLRTSVPEYTPEARDARLQGTVSLWVPIEASGAVGSNVTVLRSLGLGLDEEAIRCVKQWLFSPPSYDCSPNSTHQRVDIQFVLP